MNIMPRNRKMLVGGIIGLLILLVCCLTIVVGLLLMTVNSNSTSNPQQCQDQGGVWTVIGCVKVSATTSTSVPTPAPASSEVNVKVYFSQDPASYDDPSITVGVARSSSRTDIGTYTLEQLIAGPTASEAASGLFTPVKLSGTSNCKGKDFLLDIQASKATLNFCRDIQSAGIGDDARMQTDITKSLTQFSTVTKVVILDKNGNCLGDESGMNLCLK